jgi:hypothetical protein
MADGEVTRPFIITWNAGTASSTRSETMTCLKHLNFGNPKTLTFAQLIQMACELELEINKVNRQSRDMRVKKALENASEHVPHIIEWLTTAKKEEVKKNE